MFKLLKKEKLNKENNYSYIDKNKSQTANFILNLFSIYEKEKKIINNSVIYGIDLIVISLPTLLFMSIFNLINLNIAESIFISIFLGSALTSLTIAFSQLYYTFKEIALFNDFKKLNINEISNVVNYIEKENLDLNSDKYLINEKAFLEKLIYDSKKILNDYSDKKITYKDIKANIFMKITTYMQFK